MLISIVLIFVILLIPILIGPLRNGIQNVLLSIGLLILYIIILSIGGLPILMVLEENTNIPGTLTLGGIILGTIVTCFICYFSEVRRLEGKSEDFYDERLFYRYGLKIKSDIIPLGVRKCISQQSTEDLARNLYGSLTQKMREKFGGNANFETQLVSVNDTNFKSDRRIFVKMSFATLRKSRITFFVNLTNVGNQITVNLLAYIKNRYEWHDVLLFIVSAPFHYWTWIYHWLTGKYVISSRLGMIYNRNSYDNLDLLAYLKSATFVSMKSVEEFAQNNNLLTEELKQIIVTNINNTQNIRIEKSRGVRISKMKLINNAA